MDYPKQLWHVTELRNVFSIIAYGLNAPMGNHFCKELESCLWFLEQQKEIDEPIKMAAILIDATGLRVEQYSDAIEDSWVIRDHVPKETFLKVGEITLAKKED